jgi:hypothetical protein
MFSLFLTQVNMNPVRIALNLHGILLDHIDKVIKVLELMRDREARRGVETNEVATFKFTKFLKDSSNNYHN